MKIPSIWRCPKIEVSATYPNSTTQISHVACRKLSFWIAGEKHHPNIGNKNSVLFLFMHSTFFSNGSSWFWRGCKLKPGRTFPQTSFSSHSTHLSAWKKRLELASPKKSKWLVDDWCNTCFHQIYLYKHTPNSERFGVAQRFSLSRYPCPDATKIIQRFSTT